MHKVLLITGASRGIGAATARRAAAAGYVVGINYLRDRAAADALRADIEQAGGQAFLCPGDVSREDEVDAIFAAVDARAEALAGLVNNAGVVAPAGGFTDFSTARLRRTFDINVLGSALCARETIRRLLARNEGGAIVNLSSAAARLGSPHEFVDYAASKGAVDTLTLGLAREFADRGIRVNAVRPGLILTDIHASAGLPDRAERLAPTVPMRRAGTADEVARTIVWLLSDAASYVTGAILDVTGGR